MTHDGSRSSRIVDGCPDCARLGRRLQRLLWQQQLRQLRWLWCGSYYDDSCSYGVGNCYGVGNGYGDCDSSYDGYGKKNKRHIRHHNRHHGRKHDDCDDYGYDSYSDYGYGGNNCRDKKKWHTCVSFFTQGGP